MGGEESLRRGGYRHEDNEGEGIRVTIKRIPSGLD